MYQTKQAKAYFSTLRFKPVEGSPRCIADADAIKPARVPSRHSGRVVHSFDGGLEVVLWSDPVGPTFSSEYDHSTPYGNTIEGLLARLNAYRQNEGFNLHGCKLPKLGRDILEIWRAYAGRDGLYSSEPVDLVQEYPEKFGGLPTKKLLLHPHAVYRGHTYYLYLDDDKGNCLYFRLNNSDNWYCFAMRFCADYMEGLIGKDVAGEIARYLNALFGIENALDVFELSRVDYAITYDSPLTTSAIIEKIRDGLFRCRLKSKTYVEDDANGDSVTLGKASSGFQICCYNKGVELLKKAEYNRASMWLDLLEIEEKGTVATDPVTGEGGGLAPYFYRIEFRFWRDFLRSREIHHLRDLQAFTYRGIVAELFKLLSRKCTNDAYSDIDPEYCYLFEAPAGPSDAPAVEAGAIDGRAVLEEARARARSVRMFRKLHGLPASARSIRSACSMLAKHIGTNKNPLLAFRLVLEDFLPKLRDFAPADLTPRIAGALSTLEELLENKFFSPVGA